MRTVDFPQAAQEPARRPAERRTTGGPRPSGYASVVAVLIAGTCAGLASCASIQPYNPHHLSVDQLSRVGEICQTVMGLQPSQTLTGNLWPGDPDPASVTNDYRGCVVTLSNSLERVAAVQASRQAEQHCLSKGFATGSPDLALCVLTAEQALAPATQIRLASTTVTPFLVPTSPSYSGHVPATVRKEQLACAEIGLDPNEEAFGGCVEGLRNVLSARFMQELYRN